MGSPAEGGLYREAKQQEKNQGETFPSHIYFLSCQQETSQ